MISYSDFLFRIGAALVCGLLVGLDREIKSKPLGLRAYIMTATASAAWIMLTLNFSIETSGDASDISLDPTRIIQGLVGAIGFLGAGAIISSHEAGRLRGVASGAAVWAVGAIGVACGMGYVAEGFTLAVLYAALLLVYDFCVVSEREG